jgi:hypothetical protein
MNPKRHGPLVALALLLAGSLAFAWSPGGDPATRLAELQEKRKTAQAEFREQINAAKTDDERMKIWQSRPGKELLPEFKAVAIDAKGTPTALTAWLAVLELSGEWNDVDASKSAVEALLKDHIEAPELDQLASQLGYMADQAGRETVIAQMRLLAEKSPHKKVQAAALFGLASTLMESEDAVDKGEGREIFQRIVKDYADVKAKRGANYSDRAKGYLFELDHLQIGMKLPDMEAVDENGKKFSTADYRGKVVVLDFWGIW